MATSVISVPERATPIPNGRPECKTERIAFRADDEALFRKEENKNVVVACIHQVAKPSTVIQQVVRIDLHLNSESARGRARIYQQFLYLASLFPSLLSLSSSHSRFTFSLCIQLYGDALARPARTPLLPSVLRPACGCAFRFRALLPPGRSTYLAERERQ